MYYEPPYRTPPPVRAAPAALRTSRWARSPLLRLVSFCLCGLCALLVLAGIIIFLVFYFLRNRDGISSVLSYPDFECYQRPCGCPSVTNGRQISSRIVGGKEAEPFTYPWLVGLTNRFSTEPFCAGFIVSPNTILTAAHCLYGRFPNEIQILAKLHDIRQFYGDRHDVDRWFIHPEYRFNDSMHLNDIAVLKIQRTFAPNLQPCCLPPDSSYAYPRLSATAVVGGWGKLAAQPNNRNAATLQHVVMPIVDPQNIKCRQTIIDPTRQLCAGYDRLSIDTCAGDSGAPLLVVERDDRRNGHFVAAGIVSYGNRQCDSSISSGVYTRVSFYLPWIRTILANT